MARLVIACAMEEESAPFLKKLVEPKAVNLLGPGYCGPSKFTSGTLEGSQVLVVTSGIGTTNASVAAAEALRYFKPDAFIVAGTTGGLGEGIAAGDLIIADRALYHEANATDFGYAPGQVPRMPSVYGADAALRDHAVQVAEQTGLNHAVGTVGSSNSFVTAPLAAGVRATFPELLAVDMETAAVAQVCWMFGTPWVSLRAVSDLCDPDGADEFHRHAPGAYVTSFEMVRALASHLNALSPDERASEATNDEEPAGCRKPVRRALISVSDKDGLDQLASHLHQQGAVLVATSSTAAFIADLGIPVKEVSEVTGFPEILEGRVKTLHPAIHGGILARQGDQGSMQTLAELGIETFDLVVANLYPFSQTLLDGGTTEQCIEMIDIGGPTLIRAAAKNNESLAVLTDPAQYSAFMDASANGGLTPSERLDLATSAFQLVADYDIAIANWLSGDVSQDEHLPQWMGASYKKRIDLRYGENSHQQAALYVTQANTAAEPIGVGVASAAQLGGKELSFNNLQDASAAALAADVFGDQLAVSIIKHANPCGIAVGSSVEEAYAAALACDPLSAFGGVVATNGEVDAAVANRIVKVFTEVVVASGFTPEALEILRTKPNVRLLQTRGVLPSRFDMRHINGGLLVQDVDRPSDADRVSSWKLVSGEAASDEQTRDLEVAWRAAQFTKSNAIVLAKDGGTVGVGMGQVNRLDAAKLAVDRANTLADGQQRARGAVAASDAFFPFPDGLQVLIDAGVKAVVAPGGSMRDQLSIDAAKAAGLTLYFAGRRHFWH